MSYKKTKKGSSVSSGVKLMHRRNTLPEWTLKKKKKNTRISGAEEPNKWDEECIRKHWREDLHDGGGVRHGEHLPPHKYIKNTSTCGTAPTEHLLDTGRRPQISQKARNSPCTSPCGWQGLGALAGCQTWASEEGETSSRHWSTRDLPAPCNISRQEPYQRSPSQH